MIENLMIRAEKISGGARKLTERIKSLIWAAHNLGKIERLKDIIITLEDNGYEEAADFVRVNYPTR